MPMSETERNRILNLTNAIAPPEVHDQLRIVVEFSDDEASVVEERPRWGAAAGDEWSRLRVARLVRRPSDDTWTLYSFDSQERQQNFSKQFGIGPRFRDVLRALSDDRTGIFWG